MPSSKFSPEALPDLHGRVYVVTGGNAGIGKATVVGLASHGARVYMGARSEAKALGAISTIRKELPSADVVFLPLDLSSLSSVVAAAETVKRKETALHGLVNNAGIMGVPFARTADGFETQWQTNYVGHALLTHHLLPLLHATADAVGPAKDAVRIVNVTSDGHARFPPKEGVRLADTALEDESAMTRYGQSKLANILHAGELARRYGPQLDQAIDAQTGKIWVAAVHPGHIDTELNRQSTAVAPAAVLRVLTPIMRCMGILDDEAKGAWSSLWAVAGADFPAVVKAAAGAAEASNSTRDVVYIVPYAKLGVPSSAARDADLAARLWDWTQAELGQRGLL